MAYDEKLAERLRGLLTPTAGVSEKKMFGGLCFLLHGNMCCGILKEELVLRLEPARAEMLLAQPHTRPMDFTGRALKGFVYVKPSGLNTRAELERWVSIALEFAQSLPKKAAKNKPAAKQSRFLKQPGKTKSLR